MRPVPVAAFEACHTQPQPDCQKSAPVCRDDGLFVQTCRRRIGHTPGRTGGLEYALAGLKRGTPRMPALLWRTDHAVVIHMHDPETLAVAEGPFVFVEQRPGEIALQRYVFVD